MVKLLIDYMGTVLLPFFLTGQSKIAGVVFK